MTWLDEMRCRLGRHRAAYVMYVEDRQQGYCLRSNFCRGKIR